MHCLLFVSSWHKVTACKVNWHHHLLKLDHLPSFQKVLLGHRWARPMPGWKESLSRKSSWANLTQGWLPSFWQLTSSALLSFTYSTLTPLHQLCISFEISSLLVSSTRPSHVTQAASYQAGSPWSLKIAFQIQLKTSKPPILKSCLLTVRLYPCMEGVCLTKEFVHNANTKRMT